MSEVKMPEAKTKNPPATISREKKVEKIIQGNVKTRKKSLGKRARDVFINEDTETIKSYILMDVIIPEIKDAMMEIMGIILYGGSRKPQNKKNGSYVSYSSYSSPSYKQPKTEKRAATNDTDEFIFESRGEAEEVLSNLVDIIEDYGVATVADLYDMVGKTGSFTDNKYGWTELGSASVTRIREGYIINLPRAIFVD